MMNTDIDPYAPPSADISAYERETGQAESIRQQHIKHEASIRAIGTLYYLGGFISLLISIPILFIVFTGDLSNENNENDAVTWFVMFFYLIMAVIMLPLAYGLRRLRAWSKIPTVILSFIGLIGFPIGTLINGYFLYLLLCQKGKFIFSSEYLDIIQQTPHVKYRTSIIVWIFLGLLAALIAIAIIVPMFTSN